MKAKVRKELREAREQTCALNAGVLHICKKTFQEQPTRSTAPCLGANSNGTNFRKMFAVTVQGSAAKEFSSSISNDESIKLLLNLPDAAVQQRSI